MFIAVVIGLLMLFVLYAWISNSLTLFRTRKLMSGLTDLQAAVAANTAATAAAIAALKSPPTPPTEDADSDVAALAATLAKNNADLTAALNPGPVSSALTIGAAELTDAVVGTPYTAQLMVSGGVPPYSVTISGLPDGLTDNGGGLFSGTPTAGGTYTLSVSASDSSSPPETATASFVLVVNAAA